MPTIYCFSATGNSLYTAKKISYAIQGTVYPMTAPIEVCDDSVVGFVFPTYYIDLPIIVSEFISRLTFTAKNPYIFAVTTYGGFSFGVARYIEKLLDKKGLSLSFFAKHRSVENYSPSPVLFVNNYPFVHKTAEKSIHKICSDIQRKKTNRSYDYTFINIIQHRINPLHSHKPVNEMFHVNGCIGCGLCTKICPRGNISLENGKPVFHGNCELCTGCLHACPQNAISWQCSKKKKQYRHPQISITELIDFLHC